MNIYVGSLHYGISDDNLKEIFAEYGEVASAKIVLDRETGRSKGFGFVEMPNEDEARDAIEKLNGCEIEGRTIVCDESKERPKNNFGGRRDFNRGGGSGGGYRGGNGGGRSNFNRGGGSGERRDYGGRGE